MKTLKTFGKFLESVGEYEDSFVDINIDETELEDSDRPNLGKLKQKSGKVIIETPSKTDAYNAKMRLGGEVIQEPGFSDKQIHVVKDTNESVNWKKMTKKERIDFLVKKCSMSRKEAYEIYTEDPKELPKEIKTYVK